QALQVQSTGFLGNTTICSSPPIADNRSYASLICNGLQSKRVLFLGPSLTFTLHDHILSHVSSPMSPSPSCLGPEFCTFHHICLPPPSPSSNPSSYSIPKDSNRHLKPPSPQDLFLTRSSLMHYI